MFQKLKIYLFVMLYGVAMLRPITPLVEYAINYDYISEVLCINQDKIELECNGKCYVMTQLEKQKTEDFKSLQISMEEYPIGFVDIFELEKLPIIDIKVSKPYFHTQKYSFDAMKIEEHPPELV